MTAMMSDSEITRYSWSSIFTSSGEYFLKTIWSPTFTFWARCGRVEQLAVADGDDFAAFRTFLVGRVQDDAGLGHLFLRERLDHGAVAERSSFIP